jgi:hypothetical protein
LEETLPESVTGETRGADTMASTRGKLRRGVVVGSQKGLRGFLWIGKIIVPVSLLVALIQWTGWLQQAEPVIGPVMAWLRLPSEAVLPLVSGIAVGSYAAIAAMTVLPLSIGQMTLIAVFCMIAHNLVSEGIIQHRSGIHVVKITILRLVAAVATTLAIAPFLGDTTQSIAGSATVAIDIPFLSMLGDWGMETLLLLLKIFAIILAIMITLECLTVLDWTRHMYAAARPALRILGLPSRSAVMWVTAVVFGVMVGGSVIHEEAKRGELSRGELERLHVSIGINHSIVEDPALFMALGLSGFWMWVPKIVAAAVVVHAMRLVAYLQGELRRRGESSSPGNGPL